VLHGHCATIGRDPAEIRTSCHVRWDGSGDKLVEQCAALDGVVDMVIVYLPPGIHTGDVVAVIADALAA
jgi:hypothetical protein